MIFIETAIFTRRVKELLDDDAYAAFQQHLARFPEAGDVIEGTGTGGLRKIRVSMDGRGKRGGARVIYYHFVSASRIALLLVYAKSEKDDLSTAERAALRRIIEHWR